MKNENRFFTTQEVADLLGVSPSSIQRWADSDKLKCESTDGGHRKFSEEHLQEFAMKYNISTKFLNELNATRSQNIKRYRTPLAIAR